MKKKYAFILSFDVMFGDTSYILDEALVLTDNEELYYSDVISVKESLMNFFEEDTGDRPTTLVLLNCTRTLNDSL